MVKNGSSEFVQSGTLTKYQTSMLDLMILWAILCEHTIATFDNNISLFSKSHHVAVKQFHSSLLWCVAKNSYILPLWIRWRVLSHLYLGWLSLATMRSSGSWSYHPNTYSVSFSSSQSVGASPSHSAMCRICPFGHASSMLGLFLHTFPLFRREKILQHRLKR